MLNSIVATAAAMLGWLVVERIRDGHATTLGAASGLVAGLVAITPACGFVNGLGAILLGVVAGAICASCVGLKFKFGFDDSLDVVAVHLVGGIVGALSLGFLATHTVNPAVITPRPARSTACSTAAASSSSAVRPSRCSRRWPTAASAP